LTGWTTLTGQRAFEAPGAMRALCEIYRELDHDAAIHRVDIAAHGKLTVRPRPRLRRWRPDPRRQLRADV